MPPLLVIMCQDPKGSVLAVLVYEAGLRGPSTHIRTWYSVVAIMANQAKLIALVNTDSYKHHCLHSDTLSSSATDSGVCFGCARSDKLPPTIATHPLCGRRKPPAYPSRGVKTNTPFVVMSRRESTPLSTYTTRNTFTLPLSLPRLSH